MADELKPTRASQELARQFRENERGYQLKLAEITGISQSWLSRLAAGRIANLADARQLKRHAGIELEWWEQPAADGDAA